MRIGITGGSGGIGWACAKMAWARGYDVAVSDVRPPPEHVDAWRVSWVSVSEPKHVSAWMEVERPDAVIVAHGVRGGGAIQDLTDEEWNRVIEINLTGTFNVLQVAARAKVKSIVLIASISGLVSNGPGVKNSHYCASKGGVIALGRAAAVELADEGIRVNIVCPGPIDTPMLRRENPAVAEFIRRVPLTHEAGTPEDVAELCMFLCSDASKYISGAVIPIDGAYTAL